MDGKNIFSSETLKYQNPFYTDCPLWAQTGNGRVLTICTSISAFKTQTPKGSRLSCYVILVPHPYENYYYFILKMKSVLRPCFFVSVPRHSPTARLQAQFDCGSVQ